MCELSLCFSCAIVAWLVVRFISPSFVLLAYRKTMTDKPNIRKLQNRPIPVIGGLCVSVGIVFALLIYSFFGNIPGGYVILPCATGVVLLGFVDDMIDINATAKFIIEVLLILLLWFTDTCSINTLGGLFGIYHIPVWLSLFLSVLTGVGLMNAINMIDGVDGLSSGFGMITSAICGLFFAAHQNYGMAVVAITFVGALIPIFMRNVFSYKYKMFIGDSGALLLGFVAYFFVCNIISTPVKYKFDNYSVAFVLMIYAFPVFDTLRVMVSRVKRGISPFHAEKNHFHHAFIELGFTHFSVSTIILSGAILLIAICYALTFVGLSVTTHFIIMLGIAIMVCWFGYRHVHGMAQKRNTPIVDVVKEFAKRNERAKLLIRYTLDCKDNSTRLKLNKLNRDK